MANSKNILVVDDDTEFAGTVCDILETAGYTTFLAEDGYGALALLHRQTIDLILADIAMPRLNGYQLLARLQKIDELAMIPIVFISGRDLDSDIQYGKMLGVDDYLVKPINMDDLMAVVTGKLVQADVRAHKPPGSPPHLETPGPPSSAQNILHVDYAGHQVRYEGKLIKLSAREFRLLVRLIQAEGSVVSPQELVRATHEIEIDSAEAGTLLRPLIRTLRRKLGFPVGEMGFIENIRGVGYRLLLSQVVIMKPSQNYLEHLENSQ